MPAFNRFIDVSIVYIGVLMMCDGGSLDSDCALYATTVHIKRDYNFIDNFL